LKTVELPEKLSREDLMAIARIHFPKLADAYLEFVVEKAVATERNFVSDIEKIATLARDNAQESGRALPALEDIKAAIADVLPTISRTVPGDAGDALQPRCIVPARAVQAPRKAAVRTARGKAPAPLSSATGRINFGSENPADLVLAKGH
jgi:hypothetical protein